MNEWDNMMQHRRSRSRDSAAILSLWTLSGLLLAACGGGGGTSTSTTARPPSPSDKITAFDGPVQGARVWVDVDGDGRIGGDDYHIGLTDGMGQLDLSGIRTGHEMRGLIIELSNARDGIQAVDVSRPAEFAELSGQWLSLPAGTGDTRTVTPITDLVARRIAERKSSDPDITPQAVLDGIFGQGQVSVAQITDIANYIDNTANPTADMVTYAAVAVAHRQADYADLETLFAGHRGRLADGDSNNDRFSAEQIRIDVEDTGRVDIANLAAGVVQSLASLNSGPVSMNPNGGAGISVAGTTAIALDALFPALANAGSRQTAAERLFGFEDQLLQSDGSVGRLQGIFIAESVTLDGVTFTVGRRGEATLAGDTLPSGISPISGYHYIALANIGALEISASSTATAASGARLGFYLFDGEEVSVAPGFLVLDNHGISFGQDGYAASIREASGADNGSIRGSVAVSDARDDTTTAPQYSVAAAGINQVSGVTAAGGYGTLAIDAATGAWTYTLGRESGQNAALDLLDTGTTARDVFTVTASAAGAPPVTTTITISVAGADDAGGASPVIAAPEMVHSDGTLPASFTAKVYDSDSRSSSLSLTIIGDGTTTSIASTATGYDVFDISGDRTLIGTLTESANANAGNNRVETTWQFTPDSAFTAGTVNLVLTARDGDTASADSSVPIAIVVATPTFGGLSPTYGYSVTETTRADFGDNTTADVTVFFRDADSGAGTDYRLDGDGFHTTQVRVHDNAGAAILPATESGTWAFSAPHDYGLAVMDSQTGNTMTARYIVDDRAVAEYFRANPGAGSLTDLVTFVWTPDGSRHAPASITYAYVFERPIGAIEAGDTRPGIVLADNSVSFTETNSAADDGATLTGLFYVTDHDDTADAITIAYHQTGDTGFTDFPGGNSIAAYGPAFGDFSIAREESADDDFSGGTYAYRWTYTIRAEILDRLDTDTAYDITLRVADDTARNTRDLATASMRVNLNAIAENARPVFTTPPASFLTIRDFGQASEISTGTFTATDADAGSAGTVTLTLSVSDDSPVRLVPNGLATLEINSISATQGIRIVADGTGQFGDLPNGAHIATIFPGDLALDTAGEATASLAIRALEAAQGQREVINLIVTATDSSGAANAAFSRTIRLDFAIPANAAPVISSVTYSTEGGVTTSDSTPVVATIEITDSDDADVLTIRSVTAVAGNPVTFNPLTGFVTTLPGYGTDITGGVAIGTLTLPRTGESGTGGFFRPTITFTPSAAAFTLLDPTERESFSFEVIAADDNGDSADSAKATVQFVIERTANTAPVPTVTEEPGGATVNEDGTKLTTTGTIAHGDERDLLMQYVYEFRTSTNDPFAPLSAPLEEGTTGVFQGRYGLLTFTRTLTGGDWSYELNPADPDLIPIDDDESALETFEVRVTDNGAPAEQGIAATPITIDIAGADEGAFTINGITFTELVPLGNVDFFFARFPTEGSIWSGTATGVDGHTPGEAISIFFSERNSDIIHIGQDVETFARAFALNDAFTAARARFTISFDPSIANTNASERLLDPVFGRPSLGGDNEIGGDLNAADGTAPDGTSWLGNSARHHVDPFTLGVAVAPQITATADMTGLDVDNLSRDIAITATDNLDDGTVESITVSMRDVEGLELREILDNLVGTGNYEIVTTGDFGTGRAQITTVGTRIARLDAMGGSDTAPPTSFRLTITTAALEALGHTGTSPNQLNLILTFTAIDNSALEGNSAPLTFTATAANLPPLPTVMATSSLDITEIEEGVDGAEPTVTGEFTTGDPDTPLDNLDIFFRNTADGTQNTNARTGTSLDMRYGTITWDRSAGEWTYTLNSNDADLNTVGPGFEDTSVSETFQIIVRDGASADRTGMSQTVTINITGARENEAPAPTTSDDTDIAIEDNSNTASYTGQIMAGDNNAGDTHTWGVSTTSIDDGGTPGDSATLVHDGRTLGTMTVSDMGEWSFVFDREEAKRLQAGTNPTQMFYIIATDDNSAGNLSGEIAITITVNGRSQTPTLTGGSLSGTATESATNTGMAVSTANFMAADGDDDPLIYQARFRADSNEDWGEWTAVMVDGTYGQLSFTGTNPNRGWQYELGQTATQRTALDAHGANDPAETEEFQVRVAEAGRDGGSDPLAVTITVNGANEASVIDMPSMAIVPTDADDDAMVAVTDNGGNSYSITRTAALRDTGAEFRFEFEIESDGDTLDSTQAAGSLSVFGYDDTMPNNRGADFTTNGGPYSTQFTSSSSLQFFYNIIPSMVPFSQMPTTQRLWLVYDITNEVYPDPEPVLLNLTFPSREPTTTVQFNHSVGVQTLEYDVGTLRDDTTAEVSGALSVRTSTATSTILARNGTIAFTNTADAEMYGTLAMGTSTAGTVNWTYDVTSQPATDTEIKFSIQYVISGNDNGEYVNPPPTEITVNLAAAQPQGNADSVEIAGIRFSIADDTDLGDHENLDIGIAVFSSGGGRTGLRELPVDNPLAYIVTNNSTITLKGFVDLWNGNTELGSKVLASLVIKEGETGYVGGNAALTAFGNHAADVGDGNTTSNPISTTHTNSNGDTGSGTNGNFTYFFRDIFDAAFVGDDGAGHPSAARSFARNGITFTEESGQDLSGWDFYFANTTGAGDAFAGNAAGAAIGHVFSLTFGGTAQSGGPDFRTDDTLDEFKTKWDAYEPFGGRVALSFHEDLDTDMVTASSLLTRSMDEVSPGTLKAVGEASGGANDAISTTDSGINVDGALPNSDTDGWSDDLDARYLYNPFEVADM